MKPTLHFIRKPFVRLTLRKIGRAFACLGVTLCVSSSCGILGEKKEATRSLAQGGAACLDELGPLSNQFLEGTVDPEKWSATWTCVDDTIDLFKKYVKGSEKEGYLPGDLRFLMQQFLFSRGTVTSGLVDGTLALKASLFGGTSDRLSNDELDRFRGLARFIRNETLVLIPHLRNRKMDPTSNHLRDLAIAIETFGAHLADFLNTGTNSKFTVDQAVTLTTELAKIAFKTEPATVESWTRLGLQFKTILVRGESDGVSGADWTKILKYGFRVAGVGVAYLSSNGDDPNFEIEMVNKIQSVFNGSISDWGGAIPFSEIEKLINLAPKSILPELADDFRIGAKSLLHERVVTANGTTTRYRPFISRLFRSESDTGIDAGAIENVVSIYRAGMRANGHLKGVYSSVKEDLLPAEFEARARIYMNPLDTAAKNDVNRLITIANRYPGLHPANTPEILFLDQRRHSLNNLNRMSWYELASAFLLQAYGSTTNTYGKAATLDDLNILIDDLHLFLYSVHMYHPLKTGIGAKRFREANLFMPNGNGDDKMDLAETSVYLAYIFSASRLNSRIVQSTIQGPDPCPTKGWNVPLKIQIYEVQCFRNRFTANFSDLFTNMPRLRDELATMSTSERATWDQTLEAASKTTGYNEDPISSYDISSYAGLPHYAEAVMLRFDTNHDGALNRTEVLDNVFPIFKRELSVISKIKIDFLNKAVLLYLMQKGTKPEAWDLVKWALSLDFLKDFNARRIRVYQIFSALSPPAPADPTSQTPPPGINLPEGSSTLNGLVQGLIMGLTPVVTSPNSAPANAPASNFDLSTVDPVQLEGYGSTGPVIDPTSLYQEALEVLPQDL